MRDFDIEQAKKAAETIAKKYGLSFVALFGSQATGRVHEKIDVDIAILGKEKLDVPALKNELRNFVKNKKIAVLELDEELPIPACVAQEKGVVLYEDAPDTLLKWKTYANRVWRELAWLRNLKKWVEAGNELSPNWSRRDFMMD